MKISQNCEEELKEADGIFVVGKVNPNEKNYVLISKTEKNGKGDEENHAFVISARKYEKLGGSAVKGTDVGCSARFVGDKGAALRPFKDYMNKKASNATLMDEKEYGKLEEKPNIVKIDSASTEALKNTQDIWLCNDKLIAGKKDFVMYVTTRDGDRFNPIVIPKDLYKTYGKSGGLEGKQSVLNGIHVMGDSPDKCDRLLNYLNEKASPRAKIKFVAMATMDQKSNNHAKGNEKLILLNNFKNGDKEFVMYQCENEKNEKCFVITTKQDHTKHGVVKFPIEGKFKVFIGSEPKKRTSLLKYIGEHASTYAFIEFVG